MDNSMLGERSDRLYAQYRRAKFLPNFAASRWNNLAWRGAKQPHISVLITCFNYARYVQKALLSAANAASPDLEVEVIIVDDASKDESNTVIRAVSLALPIPVRLLRPWWNVGLSRARNLALAHARADYVFILDADNTIELDGLRLLRERILLENADAAYGTIQRIFVDGRIDGYMSDGPFDPKKLAKGNYIDAMAMFRRQALVELGGYDVELLRVIGGYEDYDLWLEFAAQGRKVAFEPELIGQYLVKPDSMVNEITYAEKRAVHAHFVEKYPAIFKSA